MNWHEIQTASHEDILAWAVDQSRARAMAGCAQDEGWHAEGDVWTHTRMACAQVPLLAEWAALTPHERSRPFPRRPSQAGLTAKTFTLAA